MADRVVALVAGLVVSAFVLGGLAGPLIDRTRWPVAHPGMAIICWAGLLIGTVTSVSGLLAFALLSPPAPAHGLLDWLDNCLPHHGHPGLVMGSAASVASVALVAVCCVRLARALPRLWRALFHLRRHREMLRIVARKDHRHPDVLVIDHPVPVAYCLPVRRRPIVMSTGAQARLGPPELAAVLAHERAHLRQRHHLLLWLLDLTGTLLPWLPTVRLARTSLPPLLEMAADDVAARRCGRRALSAALLRLTVLPGLAGALAAGEAQTGTRGQALARRLARLEAGTTDSPARARALAWVAAVGTVICALAIAAVAMMAIPLPC